MEERLKLLREKIRAAAVKAGREPDSVGLIAVSKTRTTDEIRAAANLGLRDFGENYVQELVAKHDALKDEISDLRWHFVGRLQTNKVKYIVPFVHLIHGVDSAALLYEIEKRARALRRSVDALIQLNISDEKQKNGTDETGLREMAATPLQFVRLRGLMGMAEHTDDAQALRRQFSRLRQALPPDWDVLSMGMSDDYEMAIAEGATLVRIGSALFGPRA